MVTFPSILLGLLAITHPAYSQTCTTINPANPATFAEGYSGRVVMNGLKAPRGILFDNQGNLLTTEQSSYGVRYIQLTDNGGIDVCVKSSKQLISDTSINHGITLTPDGKKLFASSRTTVWSWDYDGAAGTVSNKKTVVTGMNNGGHTTRTLLVPKAAPDVLLVHVGSNGNIDTATSQASSGRSQIRIFKIADLEAGSKAFTAGELLSYGIRNNVAIGEDTRGGIWSANNGLDEMSINGKDVHHTNPCEELNYHGLINSTSSSERGKSYGYPNCHAIWDPSVLPSPLNTEIQVGSTISHGTNSAMCSRLAPKLCFPAHTAPLDIKFNANNTAAYITFHGSWNKSPPDGYRLSRISFNPATGMPTEPVTSTTAALNIMYNANNSGCPGRCFRPVGLAWSPEGKLFMTSDTTNELWIIGGAT